MHKIYQHPPKKTAIIFFIQALLRVAFKIEILFVSICKKLDKEKFFAPNIYSNYIMITTLLVYNSHVCLLFDKRFILRNQKSSIDTSQRPC